MTDHPGDGQAGPGAESTSEEWDRLRALTDSMTPSERAFMDVVSDIKPGGRIAFLGSKSAAILLAFRAALRASEAALAEMKRDRDNLSALADQISADEVAALTRAVSAEAALAEAGDVADRLSAEVERLTAVLAERTKERDEALEEMRKHRPVSEAYRRVCEVLGIEKDILGHVRAARAEADQTATEIMRLQDELSEARAETTKAEEALRKIAEGNLGDQPWQANYDRIRAVALAAIRAPRQPDRCDSDCTTGHPSPPPPSEEPRRCKHCKATAEALGPIGMWQHCPEHEGGSLTHEWSEQA